MCVEPIIVLGTPRSGSSMTAGIFAEHGVWTGHCRAPSQLNAKGHFENKSIKRVIAGKYGAKTIVHEGRIASQLPGFKTAVLTAIAGDGYTDGDWLWKGSALFWQAFYEFDPRWVVCIRPRSQIFESCRRSGIFGKYLSETRLKEIIELHHQQMSNLMQSHGAFQVNTDEVAQGNYDSIELALEGCDITPDRKRIDAFVDSSLWHHNKNEGSPDVIEKCA